MNQAVLDLIKEPLKVTPTNLFIIEDEIEKYPYFQTLHLLKTKASTNADEKTFHKTLNLASVYTSNRKILFDYLHSYEKVESSSLNIKLSSELEAIINDTDKQDLSNSETASDTLNIPETDSQNHEENIELLDTVKDTKNSSEESAFIHKAISTNPNAIEEPTIREGDDDEITDIKLKEEEEASTSVQDFHSFNNWLRSNTNHSFTAKIDTSKDELEAKYKIIDDFLEKKPKISAVKDFTPSKKKSKSKESMSHLMTETLADLYVKQNKLDKALDAYSILSLKYPEKSGYFANRVKEIKELKTK